MWPEAFLCIDCSFPPFQVLELQNTLDDLTNRVDAVKEENLKLRSENTVLGQYIENLMQASAVFQAVSPKTGRKESAGSAMMTSASASAASAGAGACAGAQASTVGTNLGSVIRCTTRAVRGAQGTSNHP